MTMEGKLLKVNGGAEGDRTLDLMTASHALSQLSYSPTPMIKRDIKFNEEYDF